MGYNKPNRAALCVDSTVKGISAKLGNLLMTTLSAHLAPEMQCLARQEEEIYRKAEAALTTTDGQWNRILTFRTPVSATCVTFSKKKERDYSDDENFAFAHAPIRNPLGDLRISAEGLFYNGILWQEVEEISNIARLYSAVKEELEGWLDQFKNKSPRGFATWDEIGLSRACAISPNFRASLLNNGTKYPRTEPAKITIFKHGPRGLSFTPMSPLLARALQVAANLQEEKV